MNRNIALVILGLSCLLSFWLYSNSGIQIERALTAKEWQSKMVTLIDDELPETPVGPLRRADVTSNVKYLPNGTYIRVSIIRLYADESESYTAINISESGDWQISDSYLLVSPLEFKDVSSSQKQDFTDEQLILIKQLFKLDSQQSRRIDIVNEKTLLLTSLSHGSTVLFSN